MNVLEEALYYVNWGSHTDPNRGFSA
jgi:hypothetical protein